MKNKYRDYYVAPKTISTAVFNYLKRRGIKPNRKHGVHDNTDISGMRRDGLWVKVKE